MPSNDDSGDIIPGRYCIDYKCENGHTWRSFTGKSGKKKKNKKICNKCNAKGIPTCRPLKEGDIPEDYRLWGKFTCLKCKENGKTSEWGSGNAWKGYTQICKECNSDVITWILSFLQKGGSPGDRAHKIALCSKCDEVGDCRKHKNGSR